MVRKIEDLKSLDPIYVNMFKCIAQYRPKYHEHLRELWDETEKMVLDVDRVAGNAIAQIRGVMAAVKDVFNNVRELRQKGVLQNEEAYFLLVYNMYKTAYIQGQGDKVLVDGVLFQAVFEEVTYEMLNRVCDLVPGKSMLDIMETIEPLTSFKYSDVEKARVDRAEAEFEEILKALIGTGEEARLRSFVELYSRVKYWEQQFDLVMDEAFDPTVVEVRAALFSLLERFQMLPEEDVCYSPWLLMPYMEERVFPTIFARYTVGIQVHSDYQQRGVGRAMI